MKSNSYLGVHVGWKVVRAFTVEAKRRGKPRAQPIFFELINIEHPRLPNWGMLASWPLKRSAKNSPSKNLPHCLRLATYR
jgi:hypothetical protein